MGDGMTIAFRCALALVVVAAGDSEVWRVRVAAFRRHSADEATVVLSMSEPSKRFPDGCKRLRMQVDYGAEHWVLMGEPVFEREEHRTALSLLQQAQKSRRVIRLAVDSEALGRIKDRRCAVQTNFLSSEEKNGEPIFRSLYKW